MIRVSVHLYMTIPRKETDLLIVKRAIQETDSKIPEMQAETHPLNELLTTSDTFLCSAINSSLSTMTSPKNKGTFS